MAQVNTGQSKNPEELPRGFFAKTFSALSTVVEDDLSTQSKTLDERTVAVDVYALEVSEEATTLTYEKQQATTAVVVVLVLLEVLGEVLDALAKNSNLNLRRTGVTWVGCVLFDD
jgi:hypothetical protein